MVVRLTGAQTADPWYAFGGNAGGVAVPGAPITVDLDIAGLADAVENVAPGRKIHSNDNFDEQQSTGIPLGGGPHTFASDNLVVGMALGDRDEFTAECLWESLPRRYRNRAVVATDRLPVYRAVIPPRSAMRPG